MLEVTSVAAAFNRASMVAGLYGVSVTGIDKTLNGSRRRRPRIASKTLSDLHDLWQEVYFLAGIKYRDAHYQRVRLDAFAAYFAKWLADHPEIQHLGAIGPAPALHATAINALFALVGTSPSFVRCCTGSDTPSRARF